MAGVALLLAGHRDQSAWADGAEIVFSSDRDGSRGGYGDVYTMPTDGSDQVNRTPSPGWDIHADWPPLA